MFTESNPLPMRFPASADTVDVGMWPGGWHFMTAIDHHVFNALPEAEQAELLAAFNLTAEALT